MPGVSDIVLPGPPRGPLQGEAAQGPQAGGACGEPGRQGLPGARAPAGALLPGQRPLHLRRLRGGRAARGGFHGDGVGGEEGEGEFWKTSNVVVCHWSLLSIVTLRQWRWVNRGC